MLTNPNITKNAQAARSSWEGGGTMELSGNPESGLRVFPSAVIQSVRSPPLRRAGADPGGERRCGAAARDPAGGARPGALQLRAEQVLSRVES